MSEDAKADDSVPVLNPNWQEALDKVMHTSLMNKQPAALLSPEGEYQEDQGDQDEDDDVSESLGSKDTNVDSMDNDDDDVDEGDPYEDDDEDDDRDQRRRPPPRQTPSLKSPRQAPPPPPAPKSSVPPPVIHTPYDAKAEETRKKFEQNLKLQREEKYELLGRLQYFVDEKGFKPFRVLTPDDSLEDIRYEVFRAQREMSKKRNVKMMQKALVTVGAGIEMMNSWYNPLQLRLDGFSKSLLLSIREYDEIFEELHWKYCDHVSMPPEMKLIMTLCSSIWFFHMSNHGAPPPPPAHAYARTEPPNVGASDVDVPPPRSEQQQQPAQRKMQGPRRNVPGNAAAPVVFPPMGAGGSLANTGPGAGAMDVTSLLSGLGMVQKLMSQTSKF